MLSKLACLGVLWDPQASTYTKQIRGEGTYVPLKGEGLPSIPPFAAAPKKAFSAACPEEEGGDTHEEFPLPQSQEI